MHGAYSLKHSGCSDQERGREREGSRRAGDSIVHRGTGTRSVPTAGKRGNPTNLPCIQISPRCPTQPRDAHAKAPGAHRPQHTPLVSKHSPDPVFLQTAWQDGRAERFQQGGDVGQPFQGDPREIPGGAVVGRQGRTGRSDCSSKKEPVSRKLR